MVIIKNKERKLLEFPFEGTTYVIGPRETVWVKEDLAEHIKERCPLSFDFEAKASKKKPIRKVRSYPTKSLLEPQPAPTTDMVASSRMNPGWETVGDGFEGPGIEIDNI